jgi:hypothetical protein
MSFGARLIETSRVAQSVAAGWTVVKDHATLRAVWRDLTS